MLQNNVAEGTIKTHKLIHWSGLFLYIV